MTAVRRIRAAALPDLPDASWSNALLVGEELVMSGMTAHPATRQAAARGAARGAHAPARGVRGQGEARREAAGGQVGPRYQRNGDGPRIA
ncbi:RidA family protein, partial [Pseudomonas aeruginosa]|nr:RidA family protein [Pseudomonas aeruginosa]